MEGDFRITLIIISAVVICIIFVHGFITIRRNKNPYKLKTTNEKIEPVKKGFDGSGFDHDGVSKPRVVNTKKAFSQASSITDTTKEEHNASFDSVDTPSSINHESSEGNTDSQGVFNEPLQAKKNDDIGITKNHPPISAVDISLTDSGIEHLGSDTPSVSIDIGDDITDFDYGTSENEGLNSGVTDEDIIEQPVVIDTPLYDTPVTRPKPDTKEVITAKPKPKTRRKSAITKKEAIKRNQIELNFGEPLGTDDIPPMSALDTPSTAEKKQKLEPLEPEVLVVSVVMPEDNVISGAELLPILLTLGLRYGDMDIFHRHQDSAGNGKVTFSLANIMNPGTFDLDALETFTTCGLTLFMTLPNAGDAFEVFDHMLGAAKQISMEFGAQLLDDKRSVMTKQTEQHYVSKIREFERKNRIMLSDISKQQ